MFKSCEELQAKIDQYTKELESKFNGRDGKRYVMLCGGTGCIAANSMGIKEKFEDCIRREGLGDKCEVRVVGCFGM